MTIAHAWLQKHATPTARGGEFHWHPAENALPALIERLHGATPPCVLWELAPGRVLWAQAFAATAPSDSRRYTGLVATIAAAANATPAELLAELNVPAAEPWSTGSTTGSDELSRAALGDGVAIAQALLFGGDAELAAPTHREMPRAIAELEALVPADVVAARARTGTWRAPRNIATLARASYEPAAELLAAAWRGRGTPWRATIELARSQHRDIRDVARAIAVPDTQLERALTIAERAVLGEPLAWPRVVNAWGRGKLAAPDVTVRIADALAARVIGELASGRDGRAAIAAVRWHALLPAARRTALLATLAERTACLQELIDA
ncbi:MAG TPA: hypothetical protein VH143_34590 [Kofleriaceae bacterium]|jgi:hypothetical protein|nr:hypothetical protein [Kofleriaceae bacterium]